MRGARSAACAGLIALAMVMAAVPVMLPSAVLAEDNNPNPPKPKPKDPPPPPDPCANSKQKSSCKANEALRQLLREAPPPDPNADLPAQTGGTTAIGGG